MKGLLEQKEIEANVYYIGGGGGTKLSSHRQIDFVIKRNTEKNVLIPGFGKKWAKN